MNSAAKHICRPQIKSGKRNDDDIIIFKNERENKTHKQKKRVKINEKANFLI